jgi:hypothetical protein
VDRARERKDRRLAFAFASSVFLHLALAWRISFGSFGPVSRGEDGHEGGGGATFEVEIAGDVSPDRPPLPGDVDSAAAEEEQSSEAAIDVPTVRPLAREGRPERASPEASTATETAEATPRAATDPSVDGSGTGATVTDEGRTTGPDDARIRALLETSVGGAPGGSSAGTIALLADAARCPDPVAGSWTAYRYSPEFRDWARFTMRIRREGNDLRGTISTRMWRGLPSERRPPPCSAEGWDYTVEMTATGSVDGDHFDFGARTHRVARIDCPSTVFGYNPDHFHGTFDVDADRLDTLNNDGGRDIDAPYTFRRMSCDDH